MIILLYGPNTYYSRQQLKKVIEDFKKQKDPSGLNTVVFDAEKTEASQILESAVASPFLSEKRMVVVENVLTKGRRDFLEALWEIIESKKIPETTIMVFWDEELPEKKNPLADWLKKQKFSKEFKNFTPGETANWVRKELQKENMEIESLALNTLLDHPLSLDLWLLNNELQKICAFVKARGAGKINSQDIGTFLADAPDDNTFHFIDALVNKNSRLAIKLLHDQWDSGLAEPQIFGALIWQFKTLLLIKDFLNLNPGVMSDVASKKLALSPYVVKKAYGVLRNFSLETLKKIYAGLLEIDQQVKTGGEYKMLLDLLVNRVCG